MQGHEGESEQPGERRGLEEIAEQGHITERYTKAIQQLGDTSLAVRLGGIYALERIAIDSERDHPTVVEVLSAFVREQSKKCDPSAEERTTQEATETDTAFTWTAKDYVAERDVRVVYYFFYDWGWEDEGESEAE